MDRAYRGCPLPTAPATGLPGPTRTPPGGDGHFIKGHRALAPVRHIRLMSGRRLGADQDQGGADLGNVCASGACGWSRPWQPKLALLCWWPLVSGTGTRRRSAAPRRGVRWARGARRRLRICWRRRRRARGTGSSSRASPGATARRRPRPRAVPAGDAGAGRYRLPGGFGDHVEELLGGERPSRWKMPDLPVGFPPVSQNQQPAGDVRQVVEGVRLVETPGPLRLLSGQDPPEHRLARGRAGAARAVIVGGAPDHDPRPTVAVRGEQLGGHFHPGPALAATCGSGQVLAQGPVNRPVGVQVVGEDQLGATGFGGAQDGAGQRGKQLGPLRIWRACAVIDDGRAAAARAAWARSDASAATPCAPSGAWPPRLTARTVRPACSNSVTTAPPIAPVAPKTTCKEPPGSVIVMLLSRHSIPPGGRAAANSSVSTVRNGPHARAMLDPPDMGGGGRHARGSDGAHIRH